jgi:hypothetical protein
MKINRDNLSTKNPFFGIFLFYPLETVEETELYMLLLREVFKNSPLYCGVF